MTYAVSAALQEAVFGALAGDPAVTALVGAHIYDAVPAGDLPGLYVTLGPETVTDASDKSGGGALHRITLLIHSDAPGFRSAKETAAAICDALVDAALPLARGRLIHLGFERASATRRANGPERQIELRFRARVEDS